MDDKTILDHIHDLVAEEHQLRDAHRGQGLLGADRERLVELERQLDQAWDLLRRRRARAEYGEDPATEQDRSTQDVEGYLQ